MKISRRNMLKISAGTGAAAVLLREFPALAQEQPLLVRSIPDVPPSVVPHPMLDLEPTAGQEAGAF